MIYFNKSVPSVPPIVVENNSAYGSYHSFPVTLMINDEEYKTHGYYERNDYNQICTLHCNPVLVPFEKPTEHETHKKYNNSILIKRRKNIKNTNVNL